MWSTIGAQNCGIYTLYISKYILTVELKLKKKKEHWLSYHYISGEVNYGKTTIFFLEKKKIEWNSV